MIEIRDIGELTQRVQILAPVTSVGANGERLETWGEYATRWAKVEPAGGNESVADDMAMAVTRARFVFRYDSAITEKYRLVWNAQTWNIRGIEFDAQKMFVAVTCDTQTVTGSSTTDYGDFYATNSLKIRYITGSDVDSLSPEQADITADVGLTAAAAGEGYIAVIYVAAESDYLLVVSTGTTWLYSNLISDDWATSFTTAQLNAAEVNYTDTYWEDLNINTGIFEFAGNADPAQVTFSVNGTFTARGYEFAKNDEAFFKIQCPHKMKVGGTMKAHLHWTPHSRGTLENGFFVEWAVDLSFANINGIFSEKLTYELTDTCDGENYKHQMTPNSEITVPDIGISSFIVGRIFRKNSDTWKGTVSGQLPILLGFDIHYEVDAPGSRETASK